MAGRRMGSLGRLGAWRIKGLGGRLRLGPRVGPKKVPTPRPPRVWGQGGPGNEKGGPPWQPKDKVGGKCGPTQLPTLNAGACPY